MKPVITLLVLALSIQPSMAQSIGPLSVPQGPVVEEGNCLHCITPLTQPEDEVERTECGAVLEN